MIDNICSKNFPKDFFNETRHNETQIYITYGRRSFTFGYETAPTTYHTREKSSITRTLNGISAEAVRAAYGSDERKEKERSLHSRMFARDTFLKTSSTKPAMM